jgi:hypothetical protein
MITLIAATVYLTCAVLEAGFAYAYLQNEYPEMAYRHRRFDTGFALVGGLLGPAGLASTLIMRWYRFGWKIPGTK